MSLLKAENIRKSFKKSGNRHIEILKGITLELQDNKITIIVGASGAGKSTLLHVLSGLDKIDKGKIYYNDIEISNFDDEKISRFRNDNIGFIFQFHHLLPEFTAVENVSIPLMINGLSMRSALVKGEELLRNLGLAERLYHKPAELSGGEQQRIAVARAIANNPKLVFADEPTGNLDSQNSKVIHELFLELRDNFGLSFLIVTHNPELVKLADIVYEMKDGQLTLL